MRKNTKVTLIVLAIILCVYMLVKYFLIGTDNENNNDEFDRMLESVATVLLVDDVDKSVEFYEKYFGFQLYRIFPTEGKATLAVVEHKKKYVMFQDKKVFEEKKPEYIGGTISPSFSLLIDVDDAKNLYDKLKEDLEIVQELQLMFYGQYEFSVKDLNGYIITFSEDGKTIIKNLFE